MTCICNAFWNTWTSNISLCTCDAAILGQYMQGLWMTRRASMPRYATDHKRDLTTCRPLFLFPPSFQLRASAAVWSGSELMHMQSFVSQAFLRYVQCSYLRSMQVLLLSRGLCFSRADRLPWLTHVCSAIQSVWLVRTRRVSLPHFLSVSIFETQNGNRP